MGLGAYPGQQELLQALRALGHDEQAIRAADLISPKWDGRPIIMLWRAGPASPSASWGGLSPPASPPSTSTVRDCPRERRCRGWAGQGVQELILMESPLGAAYLNAQGPGWAVVALGIIVKIE